MKSVGVYHYAPSMILVKKSTLGMNAICKKKPRFWLVILFSEFDKEPSQLQKKPL